MEKRRVVCILYIAGFIPQEVKNYASFFWLQLSRICHSWYQTGNWTPIYHSSTPPHCIVYLVSRFMSPQKERMNYYFLLSKSSLPGSHFYTCGKGSSVSFFSFLTNTFIVTNLEECSMNSYLFCTGKCFAFDVLGRGSASTQ